jgi:hypothetical protein
VTIEAACKAVALFGGEGEAAIRRIADDKVEIRPVRFLSERVAYLNQRRQGLTSRREQVAQGNL